MKKILIALAALLALVGIGAALVSGKKEQLVQQRPPLVPPTVITARKLAVEPVRLTLHTTVDVEALKDAVIASRLSGFVMASPLFEGNRFKRGDVLVRLDATQAEADLLRAKAVLAQSRLQEAALASDLAAADSSDKAEQNRLERAKSLYAIEGISQEQLESIEASAASVRARRASAKVAMQSYTALYKANEATVNASNENLRYALITAPFDGVISQRLAQPGDLATPGKALLKITDLSAGTRLFVNVPQGIKAVELDVGERKLPLVAWPEAGPQGLRRFEARAPGGVFTPSTRAEGKLAIFDAKRAILLPRQCLLNDDGRTATILVIKNGSAGSVKTVEARRVVFAAIGEEGAASKETELGGLSVACAGPDVLSRLLAGVPFAVKSME
jgi:multidrug efflux pump subunit AcrA (membrane-fusion protein)